MAIDVNDPTTPTDTDPIGAPANGAQVHLRAIKLLLKQLRDRWGYTVFNDVQSTWQFVAVTWRNLNSSAGGPTTLLKGLGITAVTRVAGDVASYDLTLSLPMFSTNVRNISASVYRTDGADPGMWFGRVRTINSSTIRVTFYNLPSGALAQPTTTDTLFFSMQVAN